ncbi:MAG TPA: cyclic nucleotide-binding domain-containing protein [Acidimicrobiales bacterium]|nr:cyclic nucleotide-binding domain-containing protein [Acidimicrobiales bacterium]
MKGIDELLAEHELFAGLDQATLSLLAGCASNVVFDPGQQLFVEGGPADRFWIIRHGRVALQVTVPGAGPMTVETLGSGAVVGWSWFVPPYRWRFDATAVEVTRATVFDVGCVRAKMDQDPRVGYQLLSRFVPVIVDRLQATRLRLLDVYSVPTRGI